MVVQKVKEDRIADLTAESERLQRELKQERRKSDDNARLSASLHREVEKWKAKAAMWQSKACAPAYTSPTKFPVTADSVYVGSARQPSTAEEHLDRAAERIQTMFASCPEPYKLDTELPKDLAQKGSKMDIAGARSPPETSLKHWGASSTLYSPAGSAGAALSPYPAQYGGSSAYANSPASLSTDSHRTRVYSPPAYFSPPLSMPGVGFGTATAANSSPDCYCGNSNLWSTRSAT